MIPQDLLNLIIVVELLLIWTWNVILSWRISKLEGKGYEYNSKG